MALITAAGQGDAEAVTRLLAQGADVHAHNERGVTAVSYTHLLAHGGEAEQSRVAFADLAPSDQTDLIAFLNNLVLFKLPTE